MYRGSLMQSLVHFCKRKKEKEKESPMRQTGIRVVAVLVSCVLAVWCFDARFSGG